MKRSIVLWQSIGFAAVSVLGVILHFLYDWTGSTFAALFSAVNESTWEHMKLIFFPMLLFAIVQYLFVGKEYKAFWCIKLKGTLIGLALIPILFYTLQGVFGSTPDWINIAIFFVSVLAGFTYETKQFQNGSPLCKSNASAIFILFLIAVCFAIFTFVTPEIPLFRDPIDGSFGI